MVRTFQNPILSLVLVLSILFMRQASSWLSLVAFMYAVCCWYSDASRKVEVFLVLVSVISQFSREGEITPLLNLQPGGPGICNKGYLPLEWLLASAHKAIPSRFLSELLLLDFPSGFSSVAFDFPKTSTRQWNYLTHSWELGLQASGHIQTPLGHAYRAFRGLVSSKTLWFCLGP